MEKENRSTNILVNSVIAAIIAIVLYSTITTRIRLNKIERYLSEIEDDKETIMAIAEWVTAWSPIMMEMKGKTEYTFQDLQNRYPDAPLPPKVKAYREIKEEEKPSLLESGRKFLDEYKTK